MSDIKKCCKVLDCNHHLFQKDVYHDDCHENQYEQYQEGNHVVDYYIKKPRGDVTI